MMNTSGSRRISSAMASRSASRMVIVTISVPSGTSGSGSATAVGAEGAFFSSPPPGFDAGASAVACEGVAASAAFSCFAGAVALPRSEALSPSARMVAIGVLTATSAVPSGIRILPSVPSSVASTSIVALPVSIAAMTSPDLIGSPSFFSHFERLPFSMVGDSAGISTWIGMVAPEIHSAGWKKARRSAIDVGIKFGRIGFGVVLGEVGGGVDDFPHLGIDRLQFLFAHLGRQQAVANLLDRVLVVANLVDLLAGAIFRRVRHRMSAVAVGLHFQDVGPLAGAAPCDRLVARGLHRANVHAVDLLAGDIEGDATLGKVGLRRRPRHRCAHRVTVVLDDEDDRELPQLRHVETLIDLSLVRCAVAEIGQADKIVAAIAVGESKAGAERHLCGDNAMAAEEILLLAEHVHGAALALGVAAVASGQFGHHTFGFHSGSQHMPVVAVSRYDLIALFQGHIHANDNRFLADIEMAKAADRAHSVELPGLFLETADQQHVAQRRQFLFPGEFERGLGAVSLSSPLFLRCLLSDAFLRCSHGNSRSEREVFPVYPNSNRHERIA